MKVTISIPVTLSGYTGQRDIWEERETDWTVEVDKGEITLRSSDLQQVQFRLTELTNAIDLFEAT